jgi:hypothetical protein
MALTIVSCLKNAALKLIYVHLQDQTFFPGYTGRPLKKGREGRKGGRAGRGWRSIRERKGREEKERELRVPNDFSLFRPALNRNSDKHFTCDFCNAD